MWWKLRQLKSSKIQTWLRAIKGLGKSQNSRILAALMAALNNESYLMRQKVVRAIIDIGDARAVRQLLNLIEESFHYAAVGVLEVVLSRAATGAISENMQAAGTLGDVNGFYYDNQEGTAWLSHDRTAQPWAMDCSRVRRLMA